MHSFLDDTFVFSLEHYICFGQLHANVSTSHNSRRPDLPKSHDYSSSLVTTRSIQVPYHLPRPLQDQIVAAARRPPPTAHCQRRLRGRTGVVLSPPTTRVNAPLLLLLPSSATHRHLVWDALSAWSIGPPPSTTEGYVIIVLFNLSQTRTSTSKALIGFPQVIPVVKIT